jgi:hypothetical protein
MTFAIYWGSGSPNAWRVLQRANPSRRASGSSVSGATRQSVV